MHFQEDIFYNLLFLLSPLLTVISAAFVGYVVREIINIFNNTLFTRLLKVIFIPIAFLVYFMNYIRNVFDFDYWLESFLSGGGWESLSTGDRFIIMGPIILGIIYLAIKYVTGWGWTSEKIEQENELENK